MLASREHARARSSAYLERCSTARPRFIVVENLLAELVEVRRAGGAQRRLDDVRAEFVL